MSLKKIFNQLTNGLLNFFQHPFKLYVVLFLFVFLHFFRRVILFEKYNVPSESMMPTLIPGDIIWVNKLLYGGRIYISFNFDNHAPLNCLRLPGIRKIKPGDVICFNYPHGYDDDTMIEFKINYVYCKRVLGTPGDQIGSVDGHYWNSRELRPIGNIKEQERLRWMYDSIFVWNQNYDVLPMSKNGWNIKNWGPLIVPAKGMTIEIDDQTRELYRQIIEFETKKELDNNCTKYTFIGDYYFAVGDNAINSNDSRYWGFIPEDFIIGIVAGKKVKNKPVQLTIDN